MDTTVTLLQSLAGRDKVMRTAGYTATLLSATAKGTTAEKLATFSRQISATRTVLRLFDDVPMWKLTSTWSAGEKDMFSWLCANAANIASQIYLPVEHIAWAADHKFLSIDSANWWGAGTACWATSLFFSVLRGEADEAFTTAIRECGRQQLDECFTLLKSVSDLILAVNVLPWKGVLWAGKFSATKNACFGMVSSIISLHVILKAQRKVKLA